MSTPLVAIDVSWPALEFTSPSLFVSGKKYTAIFEYDVNDKLIAKFYELPEDATIALELNEPVEVINPEDIVIYTPTASTAFTLGCAFLANAIVAGPADVITDSTGGSAGTTMNTLSAVAAAGGDPTAAEKASMETIRTETLDNFALTVTEINLLRNRLEELISNLNAAGIISI